MRLRRVLVLRSPLQRTCRANNFLYSINIMSATGKRQAIFARRTHTHTPPHITPDKGIGRHDDKSRARPETVYIFAILRGVRARVDGK